MESTSKGFDRVSDPSTSPMDEAREQEKKSMLCLEEILDLTPSWDKTQAAHETTGTARQAKSILSTLIEPWDLLQHKETPQTAPTDSAYFAEDIGPFTPVSIKYYVFDNEFNELILCWRSRSGDFVSKLSRLLICTTEALCSKRQIWSHKTGNVLWNSRRPVLLKWIEDCKESHAVCKGDSTEPPSMPTRVLDLGPLGFEGPVKVIKTFRLRAWYIALSHCWGKLQTLTSTVGTMHERMMGIELSLLPKTFHDAVEVSRQLGIQYLWIDSVCIIQDDPEDWQKESANMADVYRNAYLTISAAAASDGSGGLHWPFQSSMQCTYDGNKTALFRKNENTHNTVTDSPLGRRAWVLQETMLSKRVVHFAADQLYWACAETHASEDGNVDHSLRETGRKVIGGFDGGRQYPTLEYRSVLRSFRHPTPEQMYYESWHVIIESYSRLEITNRNDRLAALAGITTAMQGILNDSPFLGLWIRNLREDLLWIRWPGPFSPKATASNSVLNLPSWSMLSRENACYYFEAAAIVTKGVLNDTLEIVRTSIVWSGQPLTSNVISSELIVRGRLTDLRSFENPKFWKHLHTDTFEGVQFSSGPYGSINMDSYISQNDVAHRKFHALEVRWTSNQEESHDFYSCRFLVLESDGLGNYRRVGIGRCLIRGKARISDVRQNPFLGVEKFTISLV